MRNLIGRMLSLAMLLFFHGFAAFHSTAQTAAACPTAPNLVKVNVLAAVSFDSSSGLYTYQYTVASDPSSQQDVSDFAIDFAAPISNVTSPQGWTNGTFNGRSTTHWAATAAAPLPAGTPDVGQVPPALFPIKAGKSMSGFSLQSPNPPGPVNFYVLGDGGIPETASEAEAEALMDNCPQSTGGLLDMAVSGTTQGPVQFIPVQIDIKPGGSPNAVNPNNQGVVPVAILSSSSFDATQVDPITVRFGRAAAAPVDGGHVEDVNGDGIPDLVLQFSTPATGIVCGDTSETLTGKTLQGSAIRGSDSVVTVDCKKPH